MEQLIELGEPTGNQSALHHPRDFWRLRPQPRSKRIRVYLRHVQSGDLFAVLFLSLDGDRFGIGIRSLCGVRHPPPHRNHSIQELTYLFIVIGLAILNALSGEALTLPVLLAANGGILIVTALLEQLKGLSGGRTLRITYDDMDTLKGDPEALKQDLSERTGSPVERIVINRIDLLRDTADLTLYVGKSE